MARFRKTSYTDHEFYGRNHRFEHWYRDNSLYFITSKVRGGLHAFESDQAKRVFWDCFNRSASRHHVDPWATTLMINHYHTVSYVRHGENVRKFVQQLHGSVSKLVNDLLDMRIVPFWRTSGNRDYFDGCLRDEVQLRRAFRYTILQAVRAGLVDDFRDYPHTVANVELDVAIQRAVNLNVYLPEVRYPRYEGHERHAR